MSDFSPQLAAQGLNLQAVLPLDRLPEKVLADLQAAVTDMSDYRQLLLLGHGGRRLWQAMTEAEFVSENRIDDYTTECIQQWFAEHHPDSRYSLLCPGQHIVPLQSLGKLAGWHFPSPIMVGVNQVWGSWYAYRAVVLADTDFTVSDTPDWQSACNNCDSKPCVSACPANAVSADGLDMARCIAWRKQPDSVCRNRCLARLACPVGQEHRYTDDQIEYHYGCSYQTICERYP